MDGIGNQREGTGHESDDRLDGNENANQYECERKPSPVGVRGDAVAVPGVASVLVFVPVLMRVSVPHGVSPHVCRRRLTHGSQSQFGDHRKGCIGDRFHCRLGPGRSGAAHLEMPSEIG
ncbi:hypothetical protein GCM10010245_20400 [Streptomyces spectabilis]|uniref:Uncharacterized protein n=1 Tax=Streptomyces spectabilis TaxID=68270 RepID=A0A7W8AMX4_STRST|nr:hypothetical protein [Streptomyces spectabilis]GGV10893.1 hypothetical protein GCM10010245_20400 [Streptomyces spectabilis]